MGLEIKSRHLNVYYTQYNTGITVFNVRAYIPA